MWKALECRAICGRCSTPLLPEAVDGMAWRRNMAVIFSVMSAQQLQLPFSAYLQKQTLLHDDKLK